jgi:O-antigen ligase
MVARPPATTETAVQRPSSERRDQFAYRTLLVFSIIYFARPEDFVPGLQVIHLARITAGIAIIALIFGLGSRSATRRFPLELRLMTALLFWECLAAAFGWWRGGALDVIINRCSKTVIVALLVSLVTNTVARLRKLMFIQAAAVATMTLVSILMYRGGRMGGVLGGVFDNPNDLAINISLNFPLCLMFLLRTRSVWKKLLWAVGMLAMLRGLMLTFSRTGFLALGVALLFCIVEFGIRQKRFYLIGITIVFLLAAVFLKPAGYNQRIGSIFGLNEGDSSQEERKQLLNTSLQITAHHPLLGIGPGNFESFTRSWHVTHNTYTELTSECGIPALIMFLLILRSAFKNLKKVRKQPFFASDPEVRLIAGGLWASLPGYMVGAFFASTAYLLYPYFLVSYTTALHNIGSLVPDPSLPSEKPQPRAIKTSSQLVGARNHW